MRINILLICFIFVLSSLYFSGCEDNAISLWKEFMQKSKEFPDIQRLYQNGMFDEVLVNEVNGLVLLRFHSYPEYISPYTYFAWSRADKIPLQSLEGYLWISFEKRYENIALAEEVMVPSQGIVMHHGPELSPVISSVSVEGDPIIIQNSHGLPSFGDLWMNTWADDDCLYSAWGDGTGFGKEYADMGIARLSGDPPNMTGEVLYLDPYNDTDPLSQNNKPSSLLFYNDTLYAQFHSPLGDAEVGYLGCSKDYGKTWSMFRSESPWLRKHASNFRCLFFINMGKNYELNSDGYVYAFGIGSEWSWHGPIYLLRVPCEYILDYESYEYFVSSIDDEVIWTTNESDARPLSGLITHDQVSAMYHPELKRYILLNANYIYDAPYPWGPWCFSGEWVRYGWYGYQPGIISKGTGPDSFWFTIAGQQSPDEGGVSYQCNIGKIRVKLI